MKLGITTRVVYRLLVMRSVFVWLVFWLCVTTAFAQSPEDAGPGWLQMSAPPPVTNSPSTGQMQPQSQVTGIGMTSLGGEPVIAEYITPEITTMARGLRNDPKAILDYVHNNIRYVHYFGSKKGAQVTLLERSGNDFDQCALLVALLRAADQNDTAVNFTVSYEFGAMKIPYQDMNGPDLRKWLGLTLVQTPGNWSQVATLLNNLNAQRGFPKMGNYFLLWPSGDTSNFIWLRPWVKLEASGNIYHLDPALKMITRIAGLEVPSAMQLDVSSLLGATATGATINSDFVQNLNITQLTNALGTYTANLLQDLATAHPNRTVEEVIGGFRLESVESQSLPTTLSFQVLNGIIASGDGSKDIPVQAWDNIPAAYMSKIRLQAEADNLNVIYTFPELRGRKLSLTFASGQAHIKLDDVESVAGYGGIGATANMRTYVTHPFGVWNYASPQGIIVDGRFDQNDNGLLYQRAPIPTGYVIVYDFDDPDERILKGQQQLATYKRSGKADDSAEVITETLQVMGLSWVQQSSLATAVLGAQKDVQVFHHHRCGRAASETGALQLGYYVDLPLNFDASVWRDGVPNSDSNPVKKVFEVGNYFASALEHGILEQWQNNISASTIKCVHRANAFNKKLIRATSANWDNMQTYLNAEPSEEQYTSSQRDTLRGRLNAGSVILMPSNARIAVGADWKGYGYVDRLQAGTRLSHGMIINGGYAGGFAGTKVLLSPSVPTYQYASSPTLSTPTPIATPGVASRDPVNMADGSFTLDTTDLVTGNPEPLGLSFTRFYNSNLRDFDKANMAKGWTHNYVINAAERSDALAGLGKNTPQEMAALLVGIRTAYEIYTRPPDSIYPESALWATTALIAEWAVDQLAHNAVSIAMGRQTVQFIKQPTGATSVTYVAPAGITMSLTKNAVGNYVLQQRHGNTFYFNSANRVWFIDSPYEKFMTFNYLSDGRLSNIVDAFGRTLTFDYDSNNRLHSITDDDLRHPRQVSLDYSTTYSSQGDLTSITDVEGKTSTIEYDGEHRIIKTKDAMVPARTIVENIYDTYGRVIEQWCEGDSSKAWRFAYAGCSSVETNPRGGVTTFYFDNKQRAIGTKNALGNWHRCEYDGQDHIVRQISAKGEVTENEYDASHNLTRTTEALGMLGQERTTYRFYEDAAKHLTRVRDFRGHDTTFAYNYFHQITSITAPSVNNVLPNVVQNSYLLYDGANGPAGSLEWQEDQDGYRVTYQYDSFGQMIRRTLPDDLDPTTLHYELFLYANTRGDIDEHVDFRGNATIYSRNRRRQLITRCAPEPIMGAGQVITQFQYDNAGNLWKTTDPKGYVTEQLYSATGKLLLSRLPTVPESGTPEIANHYDSCYWLDWTERREGLKSERINYAYDAAGRLQSVTDALNRSVFYDYDANGQRTAVTSPLQVTPAQTSTSAFNARGETISQTDAMSPGNVIAYEYDANGNRTKVINRNSGQFISTYYNNNQIATFTTPLLKTTTTQYTKRGMIDTITQPSLQTATFSYNSHRQLKSQLDGVTGIIPASFTYDGNGNLLVHAESSKTITRSYDNLNRLISYTYADSIDTNANYTLKYYYDKNNNLTAIKYPAHPWRFPNGEVYWVDDGVYVFYTYDSNNRLISVKDWNNRETQYKYDLAGRVTEISRPNGTKRTMEYTKAGELAVIREVAPPSKAVIAPGGYPIGAPGGSLFAFFQMSYDEAGRMKTEFIAPIPAAYEETPRTLTYDADNRISTFNGIPVIHDANGNLISGPLDNNALVAHTYDARNRLTTVAASGTVPTLSYDYDPEGNRVSITKSGQTTHYMVNPATVLSQMLVRVQPNGSATYYVYGLGLLYEAEKTRAGPEGAVRTYHCDDRGSTVALTDSTGALVERIEYSIYGKTTRRIGTTVDTPFLYNGRYGVQTDPNGLLYMRARYYNPYLCRFLNPDPLRFGAGLNFYTYANGNPVTYIDPFGLQGIPSPANIAVGFGPGFGESTADWNNRFQAVNQQALPIEASALGGAAIGAGEAAFITVGTPLVVSGLTAAGLTSAAASATVTTTLVAGGFIGGGLAVANIFQNAQAGNVNAVAFDVGTLWGAGFVGAVGGGRYIANGVSPEPTTVPYSMNPFTADTGYGFKRNSNLPFTTDLWNLMGTGPTPTSGGAAAMGISSGASLFLPQSGSSWLNPVNWWPTSSGQSSSTGK